MNEDLLTMQPDESVDDYLWRIGNMKDAGLLDMSWDELAIILNAAVVGRRNGMQESGWRKRYARMKADVEMQQFKARPLTDLDDLELHEEDVPKAASRTSMLSNDNNDNEITVDPQEYAYEKLRMRIKDERSALRRIVRKESRTDTLLELFEKTIKKFNAMPKKQLEDRHDLTDDEGFIYAILSDIHYGISFSSVGGTYNSDIARERVMNYAREIVRIAEVNSVHNCFVSLLGDMISGTIHSAIRVENKENIIEQVIGVSELVSDFLLYLSDHFDNVFVSSVSGNHSRIDLSADDALRGEKLDELIPWYCKTKLANVENVVFRKDEVDNTISVVTLLGHTFVAVHGDMDRNLSVSASAIERKIGKPVDYIIAGHLHVPECRFEHVGFIRNGSVCGSGDEYTVKKRLFAPASQVCMLVNNNGVEAVYPIML